MVHGERVSITEDTEKKAIAAAAALKAGGKRQARTNLTVGEMIDRYIESKDSVLSPSTVAGYRRIRKNAFQELMKIPGDALTQDAVQRAVNRMAKDKSPKSVSNAHGLLSAALGMYRPDFVLHTTLPQKQKKEIKIPEMEEIKKIVAQAIGTKMEIPVLFAVWFGLRASEIRGIRWEDVTGSVLQVNKAIVEGEHGPELKTTKTVSGNRKMLIPPEIMEVINRQPRQTEYIVNLSGQAMYKRFSALCKKAGVPHYRFHDLRHTNASIMILLGIKGKYMQERMGHATDHMIRNVYGHTFSDERIDTDKKVNHFLADILQTELQTK